MKTTFTLLLLITFSVFANAQITRYQLTFDQETFTPFSNGTELFAGEMWEQYDSTYIKLPFDFPVWDTIVSHVYFETTGRIILNNDHLWFIDIFTQDGLIDAESFAMGDESPIHYRFIERNKVQGIEIQVLNAVYSNFQDSVSFQLRLFEDGTIQYVLGPHTNPKVGPGQAMWQDVYCGVFHAAQLNPMNLIQAQSFFGDFSNIQDTLHQGFTEPFQNWSWDSIPPSNSRFTISPINLTGSNEISREANSIHFYGNKVWTDELTMIQVLSLNGQQLYLGNSDNSGVQIDYNGMVIVISANNQRKLCFLKSE